MFPRSETSSWFTVSDTRPGCAIVGYHIYATINKELNAANVQQRLWTALDAANYLTLRDGNINLVTTVDPALAEETLPTFYIGA